MKRRISLFLGLILCFCAWAEPVSADELYNGNWVSVLDFDSVDDYGGNTLYVPGGGSNFVNFDLPVTMNIALVDLVFSSAYSISQVGFSYGDSNYYSANINYIGGNLYRVSANLPGWGSNKIRVSFSSSNSAYVEILRFDISAYSSTQYLVEAYADIESLNFVDTIHYVPTDDVNHRFFTASTDIANNFFGVYCWVPDWYKYDYLDFEFVISASSINSISCVMGPIIVPIDYSFVNSTNQVYSDFMVTVRVDVSGLDRSASDYPMLIIEADVINGGLTGISVLNVSGGLWFDLVQPELYYLRRIRDSITSGFSNLSSWILNQTSAITSNISSNFSDLKSEFITQFSNLDYWIDTQTSELKSFFTTQFYNLDYWIDTHTSEIKSVINTQFVNLDYWLVTHTESIISAIRGDPADSEELDQESDKIQDDIDGIGQFEQDQQAVLDKNFDTIQDSVSITGFAAALAFVQSYTNLIFVGIDDYIIVFLLPLFLGLFFYICSRVPGATRWRSRPPKDGGGS